MRFLSVDIETTGLDPHKHGIIQFAAVYADSKSVITPAMYHAWIKPDGMVWDFYCLNLHERWLTNILYRIRFDDLGWSSKQQPRIHDSFATMMDDFGEWLCTKQIWRKGESKIPALGKNFGSFDNLFLQSNGLTWLFPHRSLDATPYYTYHDDERPPDLKLCKQRAINRGCVFDSADVAHTALEDALDVMTLYQFYHAGPWKLGA